MKLSIKELAASPYIQGSDIGLILDQLEHCQYQTDNLGYWMLLYKGLPYLIQEDPNNIGKYKVLGFTWLYGTGDTDMPYFPPTPHITGYRDIGPTLTFIEKVYQKCKVPGVDELPIYASFALDDYPMWDKLKDIMRYGRSSTPLDWVLDKVLDVLA